MAKKEREFKQLNDREHILVRPNIYIGAVDKNVFNDYFFDSDNNVTYQEVEYVQGFVKIINEVIDNSVDEAIRTKFEYGNKIKVTFNDENRSIIIEDNGRGIPVKKNSDDLYFPVLCWGYAKSGENFSNDENRETIGLNGVGSYCCNVFSKSFVGETCDGENKFIGKWTDNAENFECTVRKNSSRGTKVEFVPDLKRFSLKISEVFSKDSLYKKIIKQRLFNLSICFPKITFVFDGKQVKTGNTKSIFSMFGDSFEHISNDNCMFAVYPNVDDNFKFYSYINGLYLPSGGVHIDVISNEVTSIIRDKLSKKFKGIKPGEIKNKLFIVFYGLNFPSPKFDSQTKEKLTNSAKEIKTYLEGIDLEKFANKILKNSSIIDPIVEIYKIKEEFKRKQEIGTLNKKPKSVKDKKYLPPIGLNKFIVLAEGESASGGLSNSLGRENIGYYELRGVPMNTYEEKVLSILSNKEFKMLIDILELDISSDKKEDSDKWFLYNDKTYCNENDDVLIDGYYYDVKDIKENIKSITKEEVDATYYKNDTSIRRQIIDKKISYDNVVFGTDQDLDGIHIRGLLLAYFMRFAPNLIKEGKIKQLRTPLIILKTGEKIVHFFFTFNEYNEWAKNNDASKYTSKYMKGLGSWKQDEFIQLFDKHGMDFFLDTLEWTSDSMRTVHEWLSSSEVQRRKEYLMSNTFELSKV